MSIESIEFAITYKIVTQESAEYGDYTEQCFEYESYICNDFSDIISLLNKYYTVYPNDSTGLGCVNDWLYSQPEINYKTGEHTTYYLHPKNERALRYLKKR